MWLCTYLTYVTEQIWLLHCRSEPHSHHALYAYRTNIFVYIYQNTPSWNMCFTHCCHVWQQICSSNATYMPDEYISSCADVRQLCQYICLISAHCNEQIDHMYWYIYTSHCWNMPLNKYVIHSRSVPLHHYCSLHMNHTILYMQVKNKNYNFYLPCYIHVSASNKYVLHMPYICDVKISSHVMRQLC